MHAWNIVKGTGSALLSVLRLPFRAVRMNIAQIKKARQTHADNIVYIRSLYRQATRTRRQDAEPITGGFEEVMLARPQDAPSTAALQRRFLRQKRLAIATCAAVVGLSGCALANGSLLAIATLLAAPPLFFMTALSAQLRLWQLRTRRLSKEERGGLRDFIGERRRWYLEVLNPEIGKPPGEQP